MDSNLAMKFVSEYAERVERVRIVEKLIAKEQETIRLAQHRLKELDRQLQAAVFERDDAHAFALSGIKSLTPARGFVV